MPTSVMAAPWCSRRAACHYCRQARDWSLREPVAAAQAQDQSAQRPGRRTREVAALGREVAEGQHGMPKIPRRGQSACRMLPSGRRRGSLLAEASLMRRRCRRVAHASRCGSAAPGSSHRAQKTTRRLGQASRQGVAGERRARAPKPGCHGAPKTRLSPYELCPDCGQLNLVQYQLSWKGPKHGTTWLVGNPREGLKKCRCPRERVRGAGSRPSELGNPPS